MILVDTSDEKQIREYEKNKENLQSQIRNKGYSINDFVLVRTTNFLEQDHILRAICKVPFVVHINSVPASAIFDILKEQTNVNIYDEEEYEKFKKLVQTYTPLSSQYRSTIHFTLNGLVSNHSKGTFDNQNFIIIDRLNQHLGKDDFRSIRMEDTFIYGQMPLSNDAIILINEEKYEQLIQQHPWISTYNIILYKGNEKTAVEMVLTNMGIVAENIETHSAEYTERTPLYEDYFKSVTSNYGIEEIKHFYSQEYKEDDEKNLVLWQIYDRDFYNKLCSTFNLDPNDMEFLLSYKNDRWQQEDFLKNIILKIGVNEYQQFVLEYNRKIITAINEGVYPTNEEILESNQIIFGQQQKMRVCK